MKTETVEAVLRYRKAKAEESRRLMPEPLQIQDHALGEIYAEYFGLTLLGFHLSSVILAGILMERLAKEIYAFKTGETFQGTFGPVIKAIEDYISPDEKKFFIKAKDKWRDPYIHLNDKQIVPGKKVPLRKWIPGKSVEEVNAPANNQITAPIFRGEITKMIFIEVFREVHYFLEEIEKKYLSKPEKEITLFS